VSINSSTPDLTLRKTCVPWERSMSATQTPAASLKSSEEKQVSPPLIIAGGGSCGSLRTLKQLAVPPVFQDFLALSR
jgi:hypothetical protein